MVVPSVPARLSESSLARNVSLDLLAAIGVGVTTALIGSLLPTVARRDGLGPLGLAALASAPFVANFLSAFAGRLGPQTPRQLSLTRAVGAMLLVALVSIPVPLVMIGVAMGLWLTVSIGVPFQMRLWGAMYPSRQRGRLVGMIGTGRAAAAGVAALAGGLLADQLGGPAAVAIGGVIGCICALGSAGLHAPGAADGPRYSARGSLQVLRGRPMLRRIALAQAFYGGGLIAAVPLYALVHVDRLSLSLGSVGVIGILAATATTLSYLAFGAFSDRRGSVRVLHFGSMLGLVSLIGYALAPSVVVLWGAAVVIGLANAAMDIGLSSIISEQTSLDERAAAMAGWNALTGARGIAAPFVASGLVQAGILDLTGALLLCAVMTAIGVYLYLTLGATEGERVPLPGVARARALVARVAT